ncbi:MAG TPA: queuosine precursor transporter [Phycisphaerales bacterium]|nr:queuosine precursor transporter [Phycisphaerales bacterium]
MSDQPAPAGSRSFRYYDLVMAGFVAVLLCSNLIGPGKTCLFNLHADVVPEWKDGALLWGPLLAFGAGNLFFPFSYIFGDILTEVYGYARARRVIWAGFMAMLFATLMAQVVIHLPVDPREPFNERMQPALETLFGGTWRIVAASAVAFWAGDFANSYVLAKMKVLTRGRFLWTRTIGSTIVGQGLDSVIFYPVAFAGIWKSETLVQVVIFNWLFKVMVEVVLTPLTYAIVGFLKRKEGVDHFDTHTNFTPFTLKD